MNISKIYSDAIRTSDKEEALKHLSAAKQIELETFDGAEKMQHHEWLQHFYTKKFLGNLETLKNSLIEKSVQLGISYPTTNNHQQIVKTLTQVATIDDILNKYGHS